MNFTGRIFKGWNTLANGSGTNYEEGASFTVTANASLFAQWESVPVTPPGNTLAEQLAYVRNNMGDGVVFDIVVNNNVLIEPQTVSTMGRNITVDIRSASSANVRTVQLEGQGHLFSVDANITLRLQDIELRGHSNNNRALVAVGSGGTLVMNSGSRITMNTNTMETERGGGIYINGGGLEINDSAEIISNTVDARRFAHGGGIHVQNSGSVVIRGGLISENKVLSRAAVTWPGSARGGGIFISGNSNVSMTGGTISKNLTGNNGGTQGLTQNGGGIFVDNGSSFTKRAAPGSNTSGIIYGGTEGDANMTEGTGHAIHRNFGTLRNRNSTLGGFDEISTGNDVGWE
jgi:hypothetical protein